MIDHSDNRNSLRRSDRSPGTGTTPVREPHPSFSGAPSLGLMPLRLTDSTGREPVLMTHTNFAGAPVFGDRESPSFIGREPNPYSTVWTSLLRFTPAPPSHRGFRRNTRAQ